MVTRPRSLLEVEGRLLFLGVTDVGLSVCLSVGLRVPQNGPINFS